MTPTSSCSIGGSSGSGAMPPPTCHRPRLPIAGLFRVTFLATLLLALPSTMIMANGISSTEQQLQLPRHVRCSDDVDDVLLRGYASIKDINADMIDMNNKLVQHKDNNDNDPTTAFTLCPGTVLDAGGGDEEPLRPLFPVICPTKDCIIRGGDVQVEIINSSRRSIRLSGITFLDSKDVSVHVSNTYDGIVELVDCHWKNNTGRASILIDSMISTADLKVKPNVSVKIASSSITDGYTTIENGDVYRPIFSAHADLSLNDVIIAGNTGGFRRQEGQQQKRALPSSFVMNVIGGYAHVSSSTFQYNSHFTAVVRPTRKARLVIRDTKFLDNSHGMATVVALDGSQVTILDNSRFEHNLMATADVLALQGSMVDMSDCVIRSSESVVAPAVSDDTSNVTTENVVGSTLSGKSLCQGGTFVVRDNDDDEGRNVGQCLYGGDGSSNDCHGTCVAFNAPRGAASA